MPPAAPADRRRLHDRQPVRPLLQLRAQPGEDGGGLWREAVWAFKPTREGNTVVLAQRTPTRPKRASCCAAETIQTRWGLPATKWLRVFKPCRNHEHGPTPTTHCRHRPPGPLDWRRLVKWLRPTA
jgi:hypothetical protein